MLKVQNANMEIKELYQLFSKYGEIRINIKRGIAYVVFKENQKADIAKQAEHGKIYGGKEMSVQHFQWKGSYDDQGEVKQQHMEVEQEQMYEAPKIKIPIAYIFHPVVQSLRQQLVDALSKESEQLDKGIKQAEIQISKLLIDDNVKTKKMNLLKQFVNRQKQKMKDYFNKMQIHINQKFKAQYTTQQIDLTSGVHHSIPQEVDLESNSRFKQTEKFYVKSSVKRLLKISNTQFLACCDPYHNNENNSTNSLNPVYLFNINDRKPKHYFDSFISPVTSMANYVASNFHWVLLGQQNGNISTLQLEPLQIKSNEDFKCHTSPIIEIKPLISHPHDNVQYYITSTANSIKKWKVESEQRYTDIYGIDINNTNQNIAPSQGVILSMDILSKSQAIVSQKQSKIKLFNIDIGSLSFILPIQKPSFKVIKVDLNTFAFINKKSISLVDTRTQKISFNVNIPKEITTISQFDSNSIAYGGVQLVGLSDYRKDSVTWSDETTHQNSVIRDILVIDSMIISADSNSKIHLWKI